MAFESVKQNGPVWQPTHTGTKKGGDIKHLEAGDKSFIDGHYLGCETGQGPDQNSTIHKVRMTNVGDASMINGEVDQSKPEVSIWGTAVLNDNMSKTQVGAMVRIVWEGKKRPKKGGNEYHSWDVLVDNSVELYNGGGSAAVAGNTETATAATPEASPANDEDDLPF